MYTPNRLRRFVGAVGPTALALGLFAAVVTGPAGAKTNSSPSDPLRADYFAGNVVSCAQIGLPNSTTAFADGTDGIDNDDVSGVVVGGTTVNVADPLNGAVIDAVVVKGGPAYNVYSTSSGSDDGNHVPPAEDTPTEYISPLNGGGNVPTVSHWFICYHGGENPPPPPPGTGSMAVQKIATGDLANAPATVSIRVECDDVAGTTADITLPGTGGTSDPITDLDLGTTCLVTETTVIEGVVYSPVNPDDAAEGIAVIETAETLVTVQVTNDYPSVAAEVVTRPVVAAAVAASPGFTG